MLRRSSPRPRLELSRWAWASVAAIAATLGAFAPLGACSSSSDSSAGAGAATSGSSSSASTGGPVDAHQDVAPNSEDPPPFTGESYARYCGVNADGCNIATGLCGTGGATSGAAGGTAGASAGGGGSGSAGGAGGAGGSRGSGGSGGVGGASAGGSGLGGAQGGGGAAPGGFGGAGGRRDTSGAGGASVASSGGASVASSGGSTFDSGADLPGCKLTVPPDAGASGSIDGGGGGDDAGFYTPVTAMCATESMMPDNSACMSADACGPGQGCVGKLPIGTCHIYCCGDPEQCPSQTWCAPQRMIENPLVRIPVCVPASGCTLLDDAASCPPALTCAVVRTGGASATTSCVTPGVGVQNQVCPCAAGYQCSHIAGICLKLCHVGQDSDCDDRGHCEGGSNSYPAGIGTCVGP